MHNLKHKPIVFTHCQWKYGEGTLTLPTPWTYIIVLWYTITYTECDIAALLAMLQQELSTVKEGHLLSTTSSTLSMSSPDYKMILYNYCLRELDMIWNLRDSFGMQNITGSTRDII